MTARVAPLPLIGGPLNGTTRKVGARWPFYLNAQGQPMDPEVGDRFMEGRGRQIGLYVLRHPKGARPQDYFWLDTLTRYQAAKS